MKEVPEQKPETQKKHRSVDIKVSQISAEFF
jgi:hypothetical protein